MSKKKNLIVVESPTKAKTINKYLGKDYIVEPSVGHIKDLKKHTLSVDIKNGFKPIYEIIRGKKDTIKKIREEATKCEKVYIATDPDREGEAIAWHIAEEISIPGKKIERVLFNEITPKGIQEGLKNTRELDEKLYSSQQARRVLDRLIGFQISPFVSNALIKKSNLKLSAGRVQSVALRLICEREEDIENFVPFEYWNILGKFEANGKSFTGKLIEFDGVQIKNPEGSKTIQRGETQKEFQKRISNFVFISSEEDAVKLVERIKKEEYYVRSIKRNKFKSSPKPPFITSTLQQEAARKLGFSSKLTMMLAQRLYEGVSLGKEGNVGLITYMRTDSVRVSQDAISSVRNFIETKFGKKYLPTKPNEYKSKSLNVQDAHEAIRPTYLEKTPESLEKFLDKNLYELYKLIYYRFVASQMTAAEYEQTTIEIASPSFVFRASGRVLTFDGYLAVYQESSDESEKDDESKVLLPQIHENQKLTLIDVETKYSQTQPPPRYNQATLIKELEEKGIGRPSTYATIVSTLLDRKYIELKKKAFVPTELGKEVNGILINYFSDIFNVKFTAKMEDALDTIAEGKSEYVQVVGSFFTPLSKLLEKANNEIFENGVKCDVCGAPMVIRVSKKGRFLGCSRYPNCQNTKPITAFQENKEQKIAEGIFCDECGKPMVIRKGKYGEFYGCSDYPSCKGTKPINGSKAFRPIEIQDEKCPKCKSTMVLRIGRNGYFLACSRYPECKGTKKITKQEAEKLTKI
ncbi:MAG: type I DNA topoisomerase [Ignavibacteria bacterium]|nr:type I DNA topoisomerase [Ignavibacteria bacterium]